MGNDVLGATVSLGTVSEARASQREGDSKGSEKGKKVIGGLENLTGRDAELLGLF